MTLSDLASPGSFVSGVAVLVTLAPQFHAHIDGLMSETGVAQPPAETDLWRALVREGQMVARA